jgi:hypothetical protein
VYLTLIMSETRFKATLQIFLLILLGSSTAFSQASVISGSVTTSKTGYTVGIGNNRLIVVAVAHEAAAPVGTVSGITWGGQALSVAEVQSSGGGGGVLRGEIWYLDEVGISAARGSCTYDFVVTWSSGPTTEGFAAFTLKDVDQTTPVADVNSAGQNNTTNLAPGSIAADVDDIAIYAAVSNQNRTHTGATSYAEQSYQVIGGTMSFATGMRQITVAGNENPDVIWGGANSRLITVGAVFNGVASTLIRTFYSFATGAWDANTSWSFSADGSSGAVPAGVWPGRTDHVVVRTGHTITVNATDDNKICGLSPDGLALGNVGPFISSNVSMFYHIGDITIAGTLNVTGIEMMIGGYTHVLAGGTFSLASYLVNVGFLEADAASTLSTLDDFVITGGSTTIINTNSTSADDLIIDHINATLCGTGIATLQNGAGSVITYSNSATVNQICTSFTINCTGGGCTGFPVVGTNPTIVGNTGPGGVGNQNTNKLWLMANNGTFSDLGVTAAVNNGTVRQWNDQSGNGNNATQNTAGNRPIYRTGQENNLPALQFTGDLFIDGPALGIPGTSSATYFIAFRDTQTSLGGFNDGAGDFILDRTTATNGLMSLKPVTGSFYGYQKRADGGGGLGGVSTTTAVNTNSKWIEMAHSKGVSYSIYYNGAQQGTTGDSDGNLTPPDLRIGRHATTTNGGLRGFINELIAYSSVVNNAQRILINNYISAKYNITLSVNDVYTMDDPANGNFDFDVAGIGQASDGSNHKDARGSGFVRMWNPSNLGNGEFLIWGRNNLNFSGGNIDVDNTIIKERLNRVWRVSETGDVGTVSISVNMTATIGMAIGSNLRLLIDRDGDGFADNDVTPVAGSFASGIVTFSGIDFQNGDRFTIGNIDLANPLPIELISFTAVAQQAEVTLKWITASELNNDFFTVQRSQDVEQWQDVVQVKGAINSNERIDYETIDGLPFSGVSYYRLKQTDLDGEYSYSSVRRVEVSEEFQLKVYPNPSTGKFTISTGFALQRENIKLYNSIGQEMPVEFDYTNGSTSIHSNLPTGIYIFKVSRGYWRQSVRVVIE